MVLQVLKVLGLPGGSTSSSASSFTLSNPVNSTSTNSSVAPASLSLSTVSSSSSNSNSSSKGQLRSHNSRPNQPTLSDKMAPFLLYRPKDSKKDKDKRSGTPSGETTPTSLSAPTSPAPRQHAFRQSRIPTVQQPPVADKGRSRPLYSSPPPNICVEKGRIEFIKAVPSEPEPLPRPVLATVTTAAPSYAIASATAVATFQSPAQVSSGQIRVLNVSNSASALRTSTKEDGSLSTTNNNNTAMTMNVTTPARWPKEKEKEKEPSGSHNKRSIPMTLVGNSNTSSKLPDVSKLTLPSSHQQQTVAAVDARKTAEGKWTKSRTGNSPQRPSPAPSPRLFMPLPPPPPPSHHSGAQVLAKPLPKLPNVQTSPPQPPPPQIRRISVNTKPPTPPGTRIPRMNNEPTPSACLPVPSVRISVPLPANNDPNQYGIPCGNPVVAPEPVPRTSSNKVPVSGPVPGVEMNPEVGLGRGLVEDTIPDRIPAKEDKSPSNQRLLKEYETRLSEAEQRIKELESENTTLRRQLAEADARSLRLQADHVTALESQLEQQRIQYERCLDDVASNVVQALLAQKSLQAECRRLRVQVSDLESQNAALSLVVSHSLRAGSRVDPALLAQLVTGVVPQSRSDPSSPAWRHSVCSTSSDLNFPPSIAAQDANWSLRACQPSSSSSNTSSTTTTASSPTNPQNRAEEIIALLKNRLFHMPLQSCSPSANPLYRQSLPILSGDESVETTLRPATLNLHLNYSVNPKDALQEMLRSDDSQSGSVEPPSPSVKDIVHVLEQKLGSESPSTPVQASATSMSTSSQPRLLPVAKKKDNLQLAEANKSDSSIVLAEAESPVSGGEMTSKDEGYSTMSSDVQPECRTCSSSTESSFLETSASSSPATLRRFAPITLTRSLPVAKRRHAYGAGSSNSADPVLMSTHLGVKNRSISLQETTLSSGLLEEVKEVSDENDAGSHVSSEEVFAPGTAQDQVQEDQVELELLKRVKRGKASSKSGRALKAHQQHQQKRHSFYFDACRKREAGMETDGSLLTRCCSDSELYKEPVKKEPQPATFWLMDNPTAEVRWMTLQLKPKTSPAVHNGSAGHPLRRTQAHSRLGSESSRSTPSEGESEDPLARTECTEWEEDPYEACNKNPSMVRSYHYKHEEMEDWTLHLSTEDFERKVTASLTDLESPAHEVQRSSAHLTASLPSIQENSLELEEDAHDCLWNTATYFQTLETANTDSDGLSQASKRLSCLSELLFQQHSKCSSVNDLEDLESGEPIDTEFTRDFYRLIKFESSRSLAASLKSLAVSETAFKAEELANFEEPSSPPPDRQVALQSVLQFIAEQQRYCQRRQSQDAAIAVANTQTVCLQELRALCGHPEGNLEYDNWSNDEDVEDDDEEDVEHSGFSTGWVHLQRGQENAQDPQCRAALLDAMLVSSSSSCCSCCSGSPDSVCCSGKDIMEEDGYGLRKPGMGYSCLASERPTILDPGLFVRFGRQEEEAIAAFRFLEQLSPCKVDQEQSRNSTLNSILSRQANSERVSFCDSNLGSDDLSP